MEVEMKLDWPEVVALVFVIVGFLVALNTGQAWTMYLVAVLAGLFFGRRWYRRRKGDKFSLFLTMVAFLVGFGLGSLLLNIRMLVLVFLAGFAVGFWLHDKDIIKSIEY